MGIRLRWTRPRSSELGGRCPLGACHRTYIHASGLMTSRSTTCVGGTVFRSGNAVLRAGARGYYAQLDFLGAGERPTSGCVCVCVPREQLRLAATYVPTSSLDVQNQAGHSKKRRGYQAPGASPLTASIMTRRMRLASGRHGRHSHPHLQLLTVQRSRGICNRHSVPEVVVSAGTS